MNCEQSQIQIESQNVRVEQLLRDYDKLQQEILQKVGAPLPFVKTLAEKYLKEFSSILDVGHETLNNQVYLIKKGHFVRSFYEEKEISKIIQFGKDMIDIPEDLAKELKERSLLTEDCLFDAVVGSYHFSCIPKNVFEQKMKESILTRVKDGGYFVGGFFGKEHEWASIMNLTTVDIDELRSLFSSMNFSILNMNEKIEEVKDVSSDKLTKSHKITIIAQKVMAQEALD